MLPAARAVSSRLGSTRPSSQTGNIETFARLGGNRLEHAWVPGLKSHQMPSWLGRATEAAYERESFDADGLQV